MTDQNTLYTPDLSLNLLSKSSPSQFQHFQFNNNNNNINRSRIQTENFYPTTPTTNGNMMNASLLNNNSINTSNNINNTNNSNSVKPSNLSHVPCKFFKQGTCTAGANCIFSHSADLSSESAVCKYFVKGNCKFGAKCALLHTMSLYSSQSTSTNHRLVAMTPPNQSSMMEYQSLNSFSPPQAYDPFGTSAPVPSYVQEQFWRQTPRNNNNLRSTDFIGLHSSPRESSSMDYLLGTSPFSQAKKEENYFDQVMLPSSLNNDLFSPSELTRRARQDSNMIPIPSSYESRVQFYNNNHNPLFRQDNSEAINIPNKKPLQDDDFQFFMDEDESFQNNNNSNNSNNFPSLLTLPSN